MQSIGIWRFNCITPFFYYELSDQQAQMILNYETPKLD